ncbi:sulfite reductase (ferredoxin) [Raineyella antarctica]|uniref:assimilatory sulfite reductase (ferredoxin) n=1 Tax=Raineyella antarctica TaxID=1577474 RepID=A0A1G6GM13_9ACTN|nr:nitrite/sulfite reductase [Raineyella antarctica]SDB83058.1 sulfite reductase (ferredoxin) [Raineyella antarctica]
MSDDSTPTTTTPSAAPAAREHVRGPRKGRPNGQWAVDGKSPLNHNEEYKQEDDGLSVRRRILDTYSKEGFDSIAPDDLFGRMRWWGLYTQRAQGLDSSHTGKSDAELSDTYFMQRIRVDGQILSTEQVRTIAGISRDFARNTLDITDRQNIQLHWVAIEDVPELWDRLDAVGLNTITACGDTPRGFLGSPVAGIAADEIIDPTPLIEEIRERFINEPQFTNLPRKFKTAITGHPSLDVCHEINDISFVGVRHPELGAGYDLWIGGGLSTAPRFAERLGVFVRPEEAADVWAGVISIFRDYGYRRLRNKARLKFLMADWGPEKFRQVLQDEYLHRELPDGPAATSNGTPADHVGVHDQKDGRKYVGFAATVGRVGGDNFARIADLAEAAGSHRVSLTPHQKLLVLDVDPDKVDQLVEAMAGIGLQADPGPFRRATMACTGIEYCKLAFVETKGLAARVIEDLDQRFDGVPLDPPISLNINGCPNSCARIQTADIGLKGQLLGGEFGFQIHLGGGLASKDREEAGLGRTVRGLKVSSEDLPGYVDRVVRRFLDQRQGEETFSAWVARSDEKEFV